MDESLKQQIAEQSSDLRARHDDEIIESVIDDIEAQDGKEYEVTSEVLRTMLYGI